VPEHSGQPWGSQANGQHDSSPRTAWEEGQIDAFLAQHADSSLFLRSFLARGGLVDLVDILEVSISRLKLDTVYSVFLEGRDVPVAVLKTNPKGMGMVSATGPTREIRPGPAGTSADSSTRVIVIEGEAASASAPPVLTGG
jgi:hypothetical protein